MRISARGGCALATPIYFSLLCLSLLLQQSLPHIIMGLFGGNKKKELIPDVGAPSGGGGGGSSRGPSPQPGYASSVQSAAPSYRTQGTSYVPPSQGGSGYGGESRYARQPPPQQHQQQQQGYGGGQPPQQQRQQGGGGGGGYGDSRGGGGYGDNRGGSGGGGGGGHSRGGGSQANYGQSRNELLSGAPPPKSYDPYAQHHHQQDDDDPYGNGHGNGNGTGSQYQDEEEEEVEGIKQQMRFVKQESLASTRNAVRIAREAEETARATLDKLGDQSDRIANTERHLDLAKAHNDRAVDETKELEALNRSIFRPNFTMNKQKKRDKEERRILDRHNQEKEAREEVRREQYESRQRIDQTYKGMDRAADDSRYAQSRAGARGQERSRYQFEATGSDDEVEDEIDSNLDELGGLAGRLKQLAMTAGMEVDAQNKKLSKVAGKVDILDNNVVRSTQRLGRVK